MRAAESVGKHHEAHSGGISTLVCGAGLRLDPVMGAAAHTLYDWLALRNQPAPTTKVDAVIGFGHFDLNIPRHCIQWLREGRAEHVIFTGGIGAGTADLGKPEAEAFADVLLADAPELAERMIFENRSTNTAENLKFTAELLRSSWPEIELRSVALVATPCRQRRVWLTWMKHHPEVAAINQPVPASFEQTEALYASKGQDLISQLLGEWQRIRDYPAKGWITLDQIPDAVNDAAAALQEARV
jgi:hypothetical protein